MIIRAKFQKANFYRSDACNCTGKILKVFSTRIDHKYADQISISRIEILVFLEISHKKRDPFLRFQSFIKVRTFGNGLFLIHQKSKPALAHGFSFSLQTLRRISDSGC